MKKTIPYLRRTIQTLSFFFLLYLILKTAFPLELKIPVDLYLRLDPFIGIITILTKKEIILRMLPAFGVLLLVFIFGKDRKSTRLNSSHGYISHAVFCL